MNVKFKRLMALIFTLLLLVSTRVAFEPAHAAGLCAGHGYNMDNKKPIATDEMIHPKATNRKYTVQELFNDAATSFIRYDGEGKGLFLADKKEEASEGLSKEAKERIKAQRTLVGCSFAGPIGAAIESVPLGISSTITSVTSSFSTALFSEDLICDPGNPQGKMNCLDVIGVAGGDSSPDSGVIGQLGQGLYFPMLTIAFLTTACWLMYTGLIQRQFRLGLSGVAWAIVALFVGVAMMTKPNLTARGPHTINNAVLGCLVSAINGGDCTGGSSGGGQNKNISNAIGEECRSEGSEGNKAEWQVNALNCALFKTFVLDNWSRASFGYPYNELYTENPSKGGKLIELKGKANPGDFAVDLQGPGGDTRDVKTNSSRVSNMALKQLNLMTNLESASGTKEWKPLIRVAAENEKMWPYWASAANSDGSRLGTAVVGALEAFVSGVVIIMFSLWGLVYSLVSSILIMFAPVFMLFALHPGKGKRIALGWMEAIIANILKYLATSFMVMASMILYASILSSSSGMTAFIGVFIISGALWNYRKEFVNLIGATNMGGQKISNPLGEKLERKGSKFGDATSAVVGGAIGSKLAGRGMGEGAGKSLGRMLKRGNGVTANMVRQYSRSKNDAKKDNEKGKTGNVSTIGAGAQGDSSVDPWKNLRPGSNAGDSGNNNNNNNNNKDKNDFDNDDKDKFTGGGQTGNPLEEEVRRKQNEDYDEDSERKDDPKEEEYHNEEREEKPYNNSHNMEVSVSNSHEGFTPSTALNQLQKRDIPKITKNSYARQTNADMQKLVELDKQIGGKMNSYKVGETQLNELAIHRESIQQQIQTATEAGNFIKVNSLQSELGTVNAEIDKREERLIKLGNNIGELTNQRVTLAGDIKNALGNEINIRQAVINGDSELIAKFNKDLAAKGLNQIDLNGNDIEPKPTKPELPNLDGGGPERRSIKDDFDSNPFSRERKIPEITPETTSGPERRTLKDEFDSNLFERERKVPEFNPEETTGGSGSSHLRDEFHSNPFERKPEEKIDPIESSDDKPYGSSTFDPNSTKEERYERPRETFKEDTEKPVEKKTKEPVEKKKPEPKPKEESDLRKSLDKGLKGFPRKRGGLPKI